MRISFQLEDARTSSDVVDKKYQVYADSHLETIQALAKHIQRMLAIEEEAIAIYEGQYELPLHESIKLIDPTKFYTCLVQAQPQLHNREEPIEVEEQIDSLEKIRASQSNKIRICATTKQKAIESSSEESSEESEQPKRKLPPRPPRVRPLPERPKTTSIEDFVGGQTNFYFSDRNYYSDTFIQQMSQATGWMATALLLRFPKIKKLNIDVDTLIRYLRMYEHPRKTFELTEDGSGIRKSSSS